MPATLQVFWSSYITQINSDHRHVHVSPLDYDASRLSRRRGGAGHPIIGTELSMPIHITPVLRGLTGETGYVGGEQSTSDIENAREVLKEPWIGNFRRAIP